MASRRIDISGVSTTGIGADCRPTLRRSRRGLAEGEARLSVEATFRRATRDHRYCQVEQMIEAFGTLSGFADRPYCLVHQGPEHDK
jgi:hypothetical protein